MVLVRVAPTQLVNGEGWREDEELRGGREEKQPKRAVGVPSLNLP